MMLILRLKLLQFADFNCDDDADAFSLASNCGGAGGNIQVNQSLHPLPPSLPRPSETFSLAFILLLLLYFQMTHATQNSREC